MDNAKLKCNQDIIITERNAKRCAVSRKLETAIADWRGTARHKIISSPNKLADVGGHSLSGRVIGLADGEPRGAGYKSRVVVSSKKTVLKQRPDLLWSGLNR